MRTFEVVFFEVVDGAHSAPYGVKDRRTALKGRHLNSLGLQPQVGMPKISLNPEGVACPRQTGHPFRVGEVSGPPDLGLKPQAIQMPPFQGGFRAVHPRILPISPSSQGQKAGSGSARMGSSASGTPSRPWSFTRSLEVVSTATAPLARQAASMRTRLAGG